LGTGGGRLLILALLGAAWFAAELPAIHLDPVQGSALVAGRIDSILRDSLRARPADLFPLDSLRRLEERGEWSPGERPTATVGRILSLTHRPTVGWVRMDPLESRFFRIPWWYFWAKRSWTLRGIVFRATSAGIASLRIEQEIQVPLGFVGTSDAEKYPPSSSDQKQALDTLAGLWAARAVPFLISPSK